MRSFSLVMENKIDQNMEKLTNKNINCQFFCHISPPPSRPGHDQYFDVTHY